MYVIRKMGHIISHDAFIEIENHLIPQDLYNLSRTCKEYGNVFTENRIKYSIVCAIKDRFRELLRDSYDETISSFKESKGVIVGSFITDMMLGIVADCTVHVYMRGTVNKIYKHPRSTANFHLHVQSINCDDLDYDDLDCHVKSNLHTIYHNVDKNVFSFENDQLHITSIDNIFKKRSTMLRKHRESDASFKKLYNIGFNFYENKKYMTDEEIFDARYDVLYVEKNMYQMADDCRDIVIEDDVIYHGPMHFRMKPAFYIVEKNVSNVPNNKSMCLTKCNNSRCGVTMLGQNLCHYHCYPAGFFRNVKYPYYILFLRECY